MVRCLICLAGFTGPGVAAGQGQPAAPVPQVSVDPRIELLSIIFRLAGFDEYGMGRVPSYTSDVDAYFGKYRDHAVMALARSLRGTNSIGYDACMSLAVHLKDAETLKPRRAWKEPDPSLEKRWKPASAEEFVKAAKDFANASGFAGFFKEHSTLYGASVARMEELLRTRAHPEWFHQFYGSRPGAEFHLVLGMLNGPANYGVKFLAEDRKETLYCVLGVEETDEAGMPVFGPRVVETIVHEFSHSFVNHVVEAHRPAMEGSGKLLFSAVEAGMRRQAYGDWKIMIDESLVRAATIRYVLRFGGRAAADKLTASEVNRHHFAWAGELAALLGEYEENRTRYPTFESFFPRIIEFFDERAPVYAKEIEARRQATAGAEPKVVAISPAVAAVDVDPATAEIVITFDRSMRPGGFSVMYLGPEGPAHFPEITGRPAYDETGKALTLPVKLKPEWTYRFSLNDEAGGAFKSREGVALRRYDVTFTTGKPR